MDLEANMDLIVVFAVGLLLATKLSTTLWNSLAHISEGQRHGATEPLTATILQDGLL